MKRLLFFILLIGGIAFFKNEIKNLKVYKYRYPVSAAAIEHYVANPPKWVGEQIAEDLSYFEKGSLTPEIVEKAYRDDLLLVKIRDGKISYKCKKKKFRQATVLHTLEAIQKKTPLPDATFLISCADEYGSTEKKDVPVFTFAKNRQWHNVILFPDNDGLKGRDRLISRVDKGNGEYPWNVKEDRLFWRGAPNNPARIALVEMENPRIDAMVSKSDGIKKLEPFVSPKVSVTDHLKYKYLIDIDGNSCTYSRMYWILYSNSVLLKHMSDNVQWYYKGLEKDKHYIEIASNFSNLEEAMEHLDHDEALCKKVAQEGRTFAQDHLSNDAMAAYIILLLKEYNQLFSFLKN